MPTCTKSMIGMPTKTGYTFAGYYDTSAATGGKQYYTAAGASAATWDKTANTTLYARWTASAYTVGLHPNSGSGGTGSVTATYGAAMPTPITLPTRSGYAFVGYYDTSLPTGGKQYYTAAGASAATWDKVSAYTLYARWALISAITVTGGTTDKATAAQGETVTITATVPAGKEFANWTTTSAGVTLAKANCGSTALDPKPCGCCGVVFKPKSPNARFCPVCYPEAKVQAAKQWRREYYQRSKAKAALQ